MPPVAATRKEEKSTQRAPAAGRGRTRQGSGLGTSHATCWGLLRPLPIPVRPPSLAPCGSGSRSGHCALGAPGEGGRGAVAQVCHLHSNGKRARPLDRTTKTPLKPGLRPPQPSRDRTAAREVLAAACRPHPELGPIRSWVTAGLLRNASWAQLLQLQDRFPQRGLRPLERLGQQDLLPAPPQSQPLGRVFRNNYRPSLREKCWPDLKYPCHLSSSLKPCWPETWTRLIFHLLGKLLCSRVVSIIPVNSNSLGGGGWWKGTTLCCRYPWSAWRLRMTW